MGHFPRKCKLWGPSRVTSGYPPGTLYIFFFCTFRRGLIWKIRQKSGKIWAKSSKICQNKPQAAPLRFAPRRRGGGLEGICRAEVDSRTAASPRGETIAVQQ